MMNGFFTVESLKDFGTMVGVVVLLVQFLKGGLDSLILRVFKTTLQTKYLAYVLSLGLVLYQAGGSFTVADIPLYLVNAVVVALAAMKAYEEFTAAGDKAVDFNSTSNK